MSTTAISQPTTLDIKIVSDTICPWCFIGKRRLEQAISQLPQSTKQSTKFNITFQPYLLDPTLDSSKPSQNKIQRYRAKFGPRVDGIIENMKSVGRDVGINFSWDGLIGSTVDSHRLIEYADRQGKQDALVNKLFKAYFEDAKDVNDKSVLLQCGVDAGLDKDETKKLLDSDQYLDVVKEKVAENVQMGISGVPFYIIGNKYAVSGAQEPAVFKQIFAKLGVSVDDKQTTDSKEDSAPACKPGEEC